MLAMEISLNGHRLCLAGQEGGHATVYIDLMSWDMKDGIRPPSPLRVFAIKGFMNLSWPGWDSLVAGDEVRIRIVEAAAVDEPKRETRRDADAEAEQERLTYEWLRRKYETS